MKGPSFRYRLPPGSEVLGQFLTIQYETISTDRNGISTFAERAQKNLAGRTFIAEPFYMRNALRNVYEFR